MGQLLVRCKKCGSLYSSGIVVDKQSFENPAKRIIGVTSKCPLCKTANLCNKRELVYQG